MILHRPWVLVYWCQPSVFFCFCIYKNRLDSLVVIYLLSEALGGPATGTITVARHLIHDRTVCPFQSCRDTFEGTQASVQVVNDCTAR